MIQLVLKGARIAAAVTTRVFPSIAKWTSARTPAVAKFVAAAIGFELADWAIQALFGLDGTKDAATIGEFRSQLVKRVPSITWSSDNNVFENQVREFASRGHSERGLIMDVLSQIGITVDLDDTVLDLLSEASPLQQDILLVEAFNQRVQQRVGDGKLETRTSSVTHEQALMKSRLIKKLLPFYGTLELMQLSQTAWLLLEQGDYENFKRGQETYG